MSFPSEVTITIEQSDLLGTQQLFQPDIFRRYALKTQVKHALAEEKLDASMIPQNLLSLATASEGSER